VKMRYSSHILLASSLGFFFAACQKSSTTEPEVKWSCEITAAEAPNFSKTIGCQEDFTALSSPPLDVSIPGAVALKTVIDRRDSDALYFQNSKKYKIHWEFASANLSGNGKPLVPALSQFNLTEYYSPNRDFILGSVTYYQGPKVWTYEISPYDNASAAMIKLAMQKISKASFFGGELFFHPTSQAVEAEAKKLSDSVKVISTDELYAGIDYQPLNYATGIGKLVFTTAKKLETQYLGFRDIVVLDAVPNDISVTSGLITQEFQTPLSHINVLAQNRGIPNMGLRGAVTNPTLVALKGKWVKLVVGPNQYSVTEVTQEEAGRYRPYGYHG
jgi:pyruvate, water dikinase